MGDAGYIAEELLQGAPDDFVEFMKAEFALGNVTKELLDHMLQVGDMTLYQYTQIMLS